MVVYLPEREFLYNANIFQGFIHELYALLILLRIQGEIRGRLTGTMRIHTPIAKVHPDQKPLSISKVFVPLGNRVQRHGIEKDIVVLSQFICPHIAPECREEVIIRCDNFLLVRCADSIHLAPWQRDRIGAFPASVMEYTEIGLVPRVLHIVQFLYGGQKNALT